jgi:uncharacterized protein
MNRNLNARDSGGSTMLLDAVCDGDLDLVKHLLRAGADPNIPENNGITPLMEAAAWGRVDMIPLLVEHGAKLDATDNFGHSALVYARNEIQIGAIALLERLRQNNN